MDQEIFIPHTTNAIPLPPATPVAYRLAGDLTIHQAARADSLCWEHGHGSSKVAEYVPLTDGMILAEMFALSDALNATYDGSDASAPTKESARSTLALASFHMRLLHSMRVRAMSDEEDPDSVAR